MCLHNTKKALKVLFASMIILVYGGLYSRSQAGPDPLAVANRMMFLQNYKSAAHFYNRIVKKNPMSRGIRSKLGYANLRLGNPEKAIAVLKEEIVLFPEIYQDYILLGFIYFKQNRFEEAAEVCKAYNKIFRSYIQEKVYRKGFRFPLQVRDKRLQSVIKEIRMKNLNIGLPNFMLGLYHKSKGNFSKARENFRLAEKWGHDPIKCVLQQIDIELLKENWNKALKKAEEFLQDKGPQAEFYFILGYIHSQLNDLENATLFFEKALELKPYLVEAMRNLAILYDKQQKYDKASRLFERFLRISMYDVFGKYNLNYSLKNLELSKNLIDKAEVEYIFPLGSLGPLSYEVTNESALFLLRDGRLKDAVALLRNFLEIEDTSPEINYNLGQLYNTSNKLDKALMYALRAVELKPDFKDAYDLLGNIYFKTYDFERCVAKYKEVVTISPEDAMGYFNLGCAYYEFKNYEQAEDSWKKAIHYEQGKKHIKKSDEISENELAVSVIVIKRPVSFRAHKSLGKLYVEKNLPQEALKHYMKAVELESSDPELYYELGKICQIQSEQDENLIDKAIFYFEQYLYLGGKEEEEVNKRLKKLKKK